MRWSIPPSMATTHADPAGPADTTEPTEPTERAITAPTTTNYDGRVVGFPPDSTPEKRRAWFQHELKQHTHPATGKGWTQADVARAAECAEAHVCLVFGGTRKAGEVTKRIQRVTAKALRRPQADLFGHICSGCPKCGAAHEPRRVRGNDESDTNADTGDGGADA